MIQNLIKINKSQAENKKNKRNKLKIKGKIKNEK